MTEWSDDLNVLPQAHPNIQSWLLKPYILSAALKRVCSLLRVDVLEQTFKNAYDDEYPLISSNETPLVREVFLVGDEMPMTFGRVIIPKNTYDQFFNDFDSLGTNFIGEKLLYHRNAPRSAFQYAYLDESQPLNRSIFTYAKNKKPQPLWARRSVFYIENFPLLVTDIILPWVPEYVEAPC